MMDVDEFLEHHGVKGQKWGVRNKEPVVPRSVSEDHKKVSELKKKHVSELSNEQIQTVNNRLNLESNFKRMNPDTAKRGAEIAAAMLTTAAMAIRIHGMINSPLGKHLMDLGKKKTDQQLHLFAWPKP